MRPKTLGDAKAVLAAMLDLPRVLAAGVEAERNRMALYMECRSLGLDVSPHETTDVLAVKRDEAAGYAHYDEYDAQIANVRYRYRHGDPSELHDALVDLFALRRPPNNASRT
jgi:hypothetical protein